MRRSVHSNREFEFSDTALPVRQVGSAGGRVVGRERLGYLPVMPGKARVFALRASIAVSMVAVLAGLLFLATLRGWVQDPTLEQAVARIVAPNFGEVSGGVFRSGQINRRFVEFVARTYRLRTVVNVSWDASPADLAEERLLSAQGIVYRKFSWSPDGPPSTGALQQAIQSVDHDPRPLLIHCRAGRDRTGGLVGMWRISHGASLDEVVRDWAARGTPSPGWQRALRESAASHHPSQ